MAYDITITDPETGHTLRLAGRHHPTGGPYAEDGTTEASFNVTWNYNRFYEELWDQGLRHLDGMDAKQSIPLLEQAVAQLGTKRSPSYWEPSPGNAGHALAGILQLARSLPDGTIQVR